MPVECLLHPSTDMPTQDLIRRMERLSTALLSDSFDRWSGSPGLSPIGGLPRGHAVAGPAFTVRTRPGDNLAVHQALEIARPGEIMMIAAGGLIDRAIIGEQMSHYAETRGIAAFVVDGAVRDRSAIMDSTFPVFAAGVCHLGPYKSGPGELRGTVSISSLPVHDGDLVLGDDDGIAVIPRSRAEEIVAAAEKLKDTEDEWRRAIEAGQWDRSWVKESVTLCEVESLR